MATTTRDIGPIGTAARVITGLALLYIAGGATITSWGIEPQDALIGLLGLPALMVGIGLAARRYADGPIRFTGPLGIAVNLAVIVALIANDSTGGGATIFYGAALLIAAWRGQAGCEGTVIANWVLGRDDQIGCPTFTPIDEIEERFWRGAAIAEQGFRRKDGDEQAAKTVWGHSLAAAAICLGTGATIALIAILGQRG
jgi:hypothetical protein